MGYQVTATFLEYRYNVAGSLMLKQKHQRYFNATARINV